uniref:Geranylgeranyl transferase type-2 subunit alpha n=1 Tax=Setaria digitata TaxID=48799 RepID=A0A915PI17_9BILA
MHFVKKVPTTEEQKIRKERERNEKLKIYCKLRDQIFEKRMKGELDEEMLCLTASLLEKNPDIYSFWNIRRKVIDLLSKKLLEEIDDKSTKMRDNILRSEILLTEVCLKVFCLFDILHDPEMYGNKVLLNPLILFSEISLYIFCVKTNCKSYCAWFHRFWCFKQLIEPDIAEELATCEKFLKLDGRNFHCWDYRREIAKLGIYVAKEELNFSDRLINANFSNYSSWHYRSSLLPYLFPDPEKQLTVNRGDMNNVHLLGLMFDFGFASRKCSGTAVSYLSVTFDRALKVSRICDYVILRMKTGDQWIPTADAEMAKRRPFCTNCSYRFEIVGELTECRVRSSLKEPYEVINVEKGYVNLDEIYQIYHIKYKPVNEARRRFIEKLIDNCQELLKELEIEQKNEILKWPLFTYILAILELEPIEMLPTILMNLEKLAKDIDPQRCEMYEEMAMNLRINERLRQKLGDVRRIDILFRQLNGHVVGELKLDNLGLKSIEHLKYLSSFITRLDLTGNRLTTLRSFKSFRRLTHLRLHKNPITSLRGISLLPALNYLNVPETPTDNLETKDKLAWENIKTLGFDDETPRCTS